VFEIMYVRPNGIVRLSHSQQHKSLLIEL